MDIAAASLNTVEFVTGAEYRKAVSEVICSPENEIVYIVVAFWGVGAAKLIKKALKAHNADIRIVCNLTSGGTNPSVIRDLMTLHPRVTVRQNNSLHAKVVRGASRMVVGSANWSSNGLGLNGTELDGWVEAGVVVPLRDEGDDDAVSSWLEEQWMAAKAISEKDLKAAEVNWKKRRALTTHRNKTKSPFKPPYGRDYWRDRAKIAIYCSHASQKAKNEFEDVASEQPNETSDVIDFFQDWPELPKETPFVAVWYRRIKHTAIVQSCFGRISSLPDRMFVDEDGEESSIQFVQKLKKLADHEGDWSGPLTEILNTVLSDGKTVVQKIWESRPKGDDAMVVDMSELFDYMAPRPRLRGKRT